jgi:hypothetical protein
MAVSIGSKVSGFKTRIYENTELKAGQYYETVQTLDKAPPSGQEREFLLYIKQKLESEQHVYVNYAEVSGTTLTIQMKFLGSPAIPWIAVLYVIAIALQVFAIVYVAWTAYQVVTYLGGVLGPEGLGTVITIIGMIFIMYFMSTFVGMMKDIIPKPRKGE